MATSFTQGFTRRPFWESVKSTGFLLKNTFTIIGKDKDILQPLYRMVVISLLMVIVMFISLFMIFGGSMGWGFVLLIPVFLIVLYRFFFDVRQKAMQSWIVYNVAIGKDSDYPRAKEHIKSVKGQLRWLGFIDMLVAYAKSKKKGKGGGLLFNLFIGVLGEVWDLAQHYLLPAIVIEQKPWKEIVPELKQLRKNVPATFVGVFGIEFVGKVIKKLVAPVYTVFTILLLLLGVQVAKWTSFMVFSAQGYTFSLAPVLVGMFIVAIIGTIFNEIIESVKVIYFTIFYVSIKHPTKIAPALRKELTHYLLMKG